ncbi:hypothetical protein QO002_000333 [Pararhizobium capsulatum DSM 1112]|uniref:DUF1674 domain-containing protein n=1 Tax=Pararhizobium capsulatum DSM 1112 TaxID=1121113 RepID=A0ABU0BIV8_9HYPH|nr:DUF1674 domain-containing protein [Pararhizobium capsulatum]MDQ0318195.1 hypothetical protein [Pararhizobium capsulatum DSM 1112]
MTPVNDNDNRDLPKLEKKLSPAAERALQEAEARRQQAQAGEMPKELGGRGGQDPARFGDWEINGRAIDF